MVSRFAATTGYPTSRHPATVQRYVNLRASIVRTPLFLARSQDDKSIDWDRVTSEALSSDAVLIVSPDTVRSLSGFERIDNAHNGELLARLQSRGDFAEVRTITVGTLAKRNVVVLMRRHAPTP